MRGGANRLRSSLPPPLTLTLSPLAGRGELCDIAPVSRSALSRPECPGLICN